MKCKMVAIIFNVDHCFSPLFFHFPLLFFSLPPFLVLMGAEQNTGGTCRRANSWRQNEKHDRGDRMCNREAATEAVPADRVHLLIENFFFQLSSGARFSLAAQGLFLEQSNWLRYVTHDESRNRNS